MFSPIDTLLAAAYIVLACLVFHRAMPAVRFMGTVHQLKFWFLGLACGLLGMGLLLDIHWLRYLGHAALIAYVAFRICPLIKGNHARWGGGL
ncbi:MAG: hypothetical protein KDE63_01200 [Novosphingobium sp.]|nr:hypothetical protein [Novosphingobium sp.]